MTAFFVRALYSIGGIRQALGCFAHIDWKDPLRTLTLLAASALSLAVHAADIPVEDFAKRVEFHRAILSPGGDYIAVERSADDGKKLVAIVGAKELNLLGHMPAGSDFSPFRPVWANDERLIVSMTEDREDAEFEVSNGELISIDFDGGKLRRIAEHKVGVSGYRDKSSEPLNALHGFARVVHRLPAEKNHVLIWFREFEQGANYRPTLYRIHVTQGKLQRIADAPTYSASFILSPSGELKYSVGLDGQAQKDGENLWVIHRFDDGSWTEVRELDINAATFDIIASTEGSEIYVQLGYPDRPDRVVRYDLSSGASEVVFAHDEVDPSGFDFDGRTGELVAVHFDPGYPDIVLVDPEHLYSRWYPALMQAFGGYRVRITSASDDGRLLIVHVSGDREPGQFRLFNTETRKFKYLFNAASWIKAEQMAEMRPIRYEARDGTAIHGFLTLPPGADAPAPLVVMPHGGPYGVRDRWIYDRDVQFLASRGYAVLQPNFRGSGGYGWGFTEDAYGEWGGKIQEDIIDGTRWAAGLDEIDAGRICIVGASFGAYSAMMAPTLAPDLYRCAAGFAGVYNLELMWSTADIRQTRYGKNYLERAIGSDEASLRANSPLHNIDRLNVPVLLVHGSKDWRVDVRHFKQLSDALEKAGRKPETLLVKGEGHGFYNDKNRTRYLRTLDEFLDEHIGTE